MSTKLKINIVLLLIMAVSTMYFLKLIDNQERIITQYQVELYQQTQGNYKDFNELMGAPENALSYNQFRSAQQAIKELYRYMVATDIFLLISIFVVSKSISKKATG